MAFSIVAAAPLAGFLAWDLIAHPLDDGDIILGGLCGGASLLLTVVSLGFSLIMVLRNRGRSWFADVALLLNLAIGAFFAIFWFTA